MVEVNPGGYRAAGDVVALDAKMNFMTMFYRHKDGRNGDED